MKIFLSITCVIIYLVSPVLSPSQATEHSASDLSSASMSCLSCYGSVYGDRSPVFSEREIGKILKQCLPAADEGCAAAQMAISSMYLKGASPDLVKSLMWLKLAAKQNYDTAVKFLPFIEDYATSAQIEEAEKLVREWRPKKRN